MFRQRCCWCRAESYWWRCIQVYKYELVERNIYNHFSVKQVTVLLHQHLCGSVADREFFRSGSQSRGKMKLFYSHRGGPGSRPGLVKWDLWWRKWRWGRFSPSTSASPANLHSTNCSTITLFYHLGLYNRPEVAAVPGDVSPTPLKKKLFYHLLACKQVC
jgi:hypothetical protein